MMNRISLILFIFLLFFSALASGDSQNFDTIAAIGQEKSTAVADADFIPVLSVMGEEASSVDCESEFKAFSGELTLAQGCCKICTVGKACGNSCISRSYTCHKGRGCACNG